MCGSCADARREGQRSQQTSFTTKRDELEDEGEEAENVLLLRSNDGREQAVELVDALLERGRVGRNRQLLARKLSAGFALDHDTVKGRVERR